MTQQSAGPGPAHHSDDEISLLWILAVLLRERRPILLVTGIGSAFALVVGLLRAPPYTSTFSFVPQVTQDQSRAGLANLVGQFGLSLGAMTGPAQSPQFYADLLRTREILAPVAADSFSPSDAPSLPMKLSEFLAISGSNEAVVLDNTMRALRERGPRGSRWASPTGCSLG